MKPTAKIFKDYYNQKLISKLIPEKGSAFEKETKSNVINWYFKIYLN